MIASTKHLVESNSPLGRLHLLKQSVPSVLSPKYEVFCCDQNGPSARSEEGAYLNRYVTDEQRSRRPIFIATLRAAASWLFFGVARSLRIGLRYARRSRLEKQPTDSRRCRHYMRDGALALRKEQVAKWISIAGHPFLFSPIVALLVGSFLFGPIESVIGLVTGILFCLLPASLYIVRKVRIGEWCDLDVSAPEDLPRLFLGGGRLLLFYPPALTATRAPAVHQGGWPWATVWRVSRLVFAVCG